MLWAALVFVGVIVAAVVIAVLVGRSLPEEHVASRSAFIKESPDVVFAVIEDVSNHPSWRKDVKKVELLPEQNGHPRFRETSGFGDVLFEVVEITPPGRRVTKIADESQGFGGTWTYVVEPVDGGSRVTVTERGRVMNPVFRFMSKYLFGHERTMNTFLTELGRKFGHDVTTEPAPPA